MKEQPETDPPSQLQPPQKAGKTPQNAARLDRGRRASFPRQTNAAESHQPGPIARNLPAADVAVFLHALVGLPPRDGEAAEDAKRPAPRAVDTTAWIAWALAGLYACGLPSERTEDEERPGPWVPLLRVLVKEARRAGVVLAVVRHDGNLTRAAAALGTSRRAVRDCLKEAGLYPWRGVSEGDDDDASDDDDTSSPALAGSDTKGGE